MKSPILATGARLLLPVFLVFSLYILLRGHNAPGGGFIGGLIAAAGFALIAFAEGTPAARRALRLDPITLGALGLIAALVSGFASALAGLAPFTGLWAEAAGYAISTVLLFDIGVYLAVLGAILTLIFALEDAP